MRLAVRHVTRYAYEAPVGYGVQQLRLNPRDGAGQSVEAWRIDLDGAEEVLRFDDHNGAAVILVAIEGASEVRVVCEGAVSVEEGRAGVSGAHAGALPLWAYLRRTPLTEPDAAVRALAEAVPAAPDDPAWGHLLMAAIRESVAYEIGATGVATSAAQALADGRGVCQDQAHLFVSAARTLGIPARYVSGYLMMNDRVEQDATHAWAEIHVPGIGWTGFDVANGISPDARYIRLAAGLDYAEAAPIRGTLFGGAGEELTVEVQVQQQQ